MSMRLIKGTIRDGQFIDDPICRVPGAVLTSMQAVRCFLQTHAGREIGGFEGRDWRIKQASGCLVPIYAASIDGTTTLVIR